MTKTAVENVVKTALVKALQGRRSEERWRMQRHADC
jgi:hypothetical protein